MENVGGFRTGSPVLYGRISGDGWTFSYKAEAAVKETSQSRVRSWSVDTSDQAGRLATVVLGPNEPIYVRRSIAVGGVERRYHLDHLWCLAQLTRCMSGTLCLNFSELRHTTAHALSSVHPSCVLVLSVHVCL